MRNLIIIVALALFIPLAASAGDCCNPCQPKCSPCKTACSPCKAECTPKCSPCRDVCKPKCDPCKPKRETCKPACNLCKPACNPCKLADCTKPCGQCAQPGCGTGCAMPCACSEWQDYCGCGVLTGLCISLETGCGGGTAEPVYLILRDERMNELAVIELAAPIEGYYQMQYIFDTPLDATMPVEALLLNESDDSVTLEWMQIVGLMNCESHTYFDHACPGVVIGQDGCPRMVLY